MTLRVRHKPRFTPIPPAAFTAALGVAGWVDTDVSGTTGLDTHRLWLVNHIVAGFASQQAGVRPLGSVVDTSYIRAMAAHVTTVSATGHVELYRNAAADTAYVFEGYWD